LIALPELFDPGLMAAGDRVLSIDFAHKCLGGDAPPGAPGVQLENATMSQSAVRESISNHAVLQLPDGQSIELPVITGSENEKPWTSAS
jgi:hypothetical protein